MLLTILLIVGVIAIVASWFVAVRLITGDQPTAPATAARDTLRPQDLAGATGR